MGFDAMGAIVCAPLDADARAAVNGGCRVHMGWSDACDGCTTTPAKYGSAGPAGCTDGRGADGTCGTYTLGTESVRMYGLNIDGDMDGSDKLNLGFACAGGAPMSSMAMGMCPAGQALVGLELDGTLACASVSADTLDYATDQCAAHLGWRDACNGCTDDPIKAGRASEAVCDVFSGADCDCTVHTLGAETVRMFGLNFDGDVDFDDKLHTSLACGDVPATVASAVSCPAGQVAVGVVSDGSVECVSTASLIDDYMRSSCYLYFGWRDACDGCTSGPAKWGRASATACDVGAGADNTCATHTLGGAPVSMFGLNTDGDVGGNDTFFVGFSCL